MYTAEDNIFYITDCTVCKKKYTTKEFLALDLLHNKTKEQCEQDIPPDMEINDPYGYILVYRNCKCNNTMAITKRVLYYKS